MPTVPSGMGPLSVHLFQLSTINPPVDGPVLYVCTQLAGSTRALQPPPGFRMPRSGVTGVDLEVSVAGDFARSPLNIQPLHQQQTTASPASHTSVDDMHE